MGGQGEAVKECGQRLISFFVRAGPRRTVTYTMGGGFATLLLAAENRDPDAIETAGPVLIEAGQNC